MSGDLTEDEVRELIREEVDRGRSIGRLPKLLMASTLILAVIAIPVLGDVNIRDTGDLILRDDTGLDLKGSTIDNLGAPQDPDDAVNKNYVDSNLAKSPGETAESKCSKYEVLNGYGQCVEVQYDEPKYSGDPYPADIVAENYDRFENESAKMTIIEADNPKKTGEYTYTFKYRIKAYSGYHPSISKVEIVKQSKSGTDILWNKSLTLEPYSQEVRRLAEDDQVSTYLRQGDKLIGRAYIQNSHENDNNYAKLDGQNLEYTGDYKPIPPK
jgi:hypothetical protein